MIYRTNLLWEIKKSVLGTLIPLYGEEESRAILDVLIESYFGLSRTDQALNRGYRLSESELVDLHFAVKKLKRFMPLQYILGKTEFMGIPLRVNESVLIPRPETEELVQTVIEESSAPASILDIGTGSGAIAIALKQAFPETEVWAVDVSPAALQVAKGNARALHADIKFLQGDMLSSGFQDKLPGFELIVSNPPYVTRSEERLMHSNVLNYEPHEALFVPQNDPLLFYRAIASFSTGHLERGGKLYVEINEAFAREVSLLLKDYGFEAVKIYRDLHGKHRFVSGGLNRK